MRAEPPVEADASIHIEALRVVFGRTVALRSVDLHLRPGIVGLFGPNGSGKSTLLRAVAGLFEPASGWVSIAGQRWGRAAADERLRARIGYAGHRSGLYDELSVRENLELFAALHGSPRADIGALIHALGLAADEGSHAGVLSAGQRRRAAVARALVHDPDILLLDEPYANLDDDASELVSDAVRSWHSPGRVAIIATHGAKRVKAFADASVILQRGRVVSHRVRTVAEGVP